MLCSLLCGMQRADPQHATEQGLSPQGSTSPIYCLFSSSSALLAGLYGDSERQKGPVIEREWRVSTACLLSGNKGRVRGHQREGRGEGMGRETTDCFGSPDSSDVREKRHLRSWGWRLFSKNFFYLCKSRHDSYVRVALIEIHHTALNSVALYCKDDWRASIYSSSAISNHNRCYDNQRCTFFHCAFSSSWLHIVGNAE